MELKFATIEDFDFFFEIKNEKHNMFWTGQSEKPNREKLYDFFTRCIRHNQEKDTRKLYILYNDEKNKVGYGYLDPKGEECEWSVALKKEWCGKGLGKATLKKAMEIGRKMQFSSMVAYVREDNTASIKMLKACGFVKTNIINEEYIPMLNKYVAMYKWTANLSR